MKPTEMYQEEKAEARACGDFDFPTYSEWLHNLHNPHAERIRAEERIHAEERWRWVETSPIKSRG
jgi:hypothetical protein